MNYILRPCQKEAVEAGLKFFLDKKNKKNGFLVEPTAFGKSLVIANIALRLDSPTLILQPSKELLQQNYNKYISYGYEASIYSASLKIKEIGEVTFATIGSIYKKPELFKDFKYVMVDECHRLSPKQEGMYSSFFNELNIKLLGLSVHEESIIELQGGVFKKGFVGSISQAFEILLKNDYKINLYEGLEYINLEKDCILSRGWNENSFCWKKIKNFIRHSGKDIDLLNIKANSNNISLTKTHSIYKAVKNKKNIVYSELGSRNYKYDCKINHSHSEDIDNGDVLLGDNGCGWNNCKEKVFDLVDFILNEMPNSKPKAVVDLSKINIELLLPYTTGNSKIGMAYRWKRTNSLPLFVYKKLECYLEKNIWVRLEGSNILTNRFLQLSDIAHFLGFYLGDGWIENKSGKISFAVEDKLKYLFLEELKNISCFKWNPQIRKKTKYNINNKSVEIQVNNLILANLLRYINVDQKCYNKYILGEWIISWDKKARKELLNGLIDSDGHLSIRESGKKIVFYTTTSKSLATSLLSLLRSLGISGGLNERKHQGGGYINERKINGKRQAYTVHWSTNFMNNVNDKHKGKRQKFIHNDLKFNELIVRNISTSTSKYLYDLEMDGHPSFVASGILVHNTATPFRLKAYMYPEPHSKLNFLNRMRPKTFQQVVHVTQISEMTKNKWWSPLEYIVEPFDTSKLKLNSTGANYTDKSINTSMKAQSISEQSIYWAKKLKGQGRKQILIFLPSIAEAAYVAKKLGVNTINSETKSKDRDIVLKNFETGKNYAITNVGVLNIGYDNQKIDSIIDCIPTLSLAMQYQKLGRGVRIDMSETPTKKDCVIVDLVGNFNMFGKIEDLEIKEVNGKWCVTSGTKMLTNVPLNKESPIPELEDEILGFGKFTGKKYKDVPKWYWKYISENFKRETRNEALFRYIDSKDL